MTPGNAFDGIPRRQECSAGFTLLELLVAMSLLALIFTMMAGGLRFGVAAWERGGEESQRADELRRVQTLLRRQLEQIRPLTDPVHRRERYLAFRGADDGLRFVGPPPAQVAKPGLYLYEVSKAPSSTGAALRLSWRQLQPDLSDYREDREMKGTILVDTIDSATLEYFGRRTANEPPSWHQSWSERAHLPQLIRLVIRYPGDDPRFWPRLTVAPQLQSIR